MLKIVFRATLCILFICVIIISLLRLVELQNYKVELDCQMEGGFVGMLKSDEYYVGTDSYKDDNGERVQYVWCQADAKYAIYNTKTRARIPIMPYDYESFKITNLTLEYQIKCDGELVDTIITRVNTASADLSKVVDVPVEKKGAISVFCEIVDCDLTLMPKLYVPEVFICCVSLIELVLCVIELVKLIGKYRQMYLPIKDK